MNAPRVIRNKTWSELKVGDSATVERACAVQDLLLFAHVSGNTNPLMLPPTDGGATTPETIAPSMWVGSLISAVLGNLLPGPGTLYRSQTLAFRAACTSATGCGRSSPARKSARSRQQCSRRAS
jgi:acyl dehydratase